MCRLALLHMREIYQHRMRCIRIFQSLYQQEITMIRQIGQHIHSSRARTPENIEPEPKALPPDPFRGIMSIRNGESPLPAATTLESGELHIQGALSAQSKRGSECGARSLSSAMSLMVEGRLLLRSLTGIFMDTAEFSGIEVACERSAFSETIGQIATNGRTDRAVSSSLIMQEASVCPFSGSNGSTGGLLFKSPEVDDVIAVGETDINSKGDEVSGYMHLGEEGLDISTLAERYRSGQVRDRSSLNEVLAILREPVGLFIKSVPRYSGSIELDCHALAEMLVIQDHLQRKTAISLPIHIYNYDLHRETSSVTLLSQPQLDEMGGKLKPFLRRFPMITRERMTELSRSYARQFITAGVRAFSDTPVRQPVKQ